MKNRKFLKALAALAVGTVMVSSFAFAACDPDTGDTGDTGDNGGGTTTHSHVWSTTGTDNSDGTHKLKCEGEGECNEGGYKNEAHNTSGTDGACTVCGYKPSGTVDPDPGPGETTQSKTISVDFANVSSVADGQAIGDTGFTAHGSGISVGSQGGNKVINFGGAVWSNGALARALGFKAEKAGKVEVTVEYSQGNAGRYLDLITADGTVLATSVEMPTEANNKTVKTYTLIAYTTSDNLQLYVGSHSSGIYILKATVKNTWTTDSSSLLPAITESDVTISKATTSYTLVNDKISVSTSDVTSLGKTGGTSLEGYGYTVTKGLYKGTEKQEGSDVTVAANDYSVKLVATLGGSTISKDIPLTIAYPTDITVTVPADAEVVGASYTLNKADIEIKANDADKTALDANVWTITYTVTASGSGSVTGEGPWTLTAGEYSVAISASREGVSAISKTVNLTVTGETKDLNMTFKAEYAAATVGTVLFQNAAKGDVAEGAVFKVSVATEISASSKKEDNSANAFYQRGKKLDSGDIDGATNSVQCETAQNQNLLKFELAAGYSYKITIATSSNGSSKAKWKLNDVEQEGGTNNGTTYLVWNIDKSDDPITTYLLITNSTKGRIGSIVIEATYVG